jgi:hypothetical protein
MSEDFSVIEDGFTEPIEGGQPAGLVEPTPEGGEASVVEAAASHGFIEGASAPSEEQNAFATADSQGMCGPSFDVPQSPQLGVHFPSNKTKNSY